MNWHLFLELTNNLCYWYWTLYIMIESLTVLLQLFAIYMGIKKLIIPYWSVVKVFRFLRPVRKLMWVLFVVSYAFKGFDRTFYIVLFFITLSAFWYKDDHGDDPRQKKPSKVASLVKSLGHRLEVIPNGAH